MKTAIFYVSVHHGNTARLAKAVGEAMGADIYSPEQLTHELLKNYDLVGFFSGIYKFRHHDDLIGAVEKLPRQNGKMAFIGSTSGSGRKAYHKKLADALARRGFRIIGEYTCRGFITFGPFGLFGGVNKGRPDEKDLAEAAAFFNNMAANQVKSQVDSK